MAAAVPFRGSRCPNDLARLRSRFHSLVRPSTNPARAPITARSSCASALRCRTACNRRGRLGPNSDNRLASTRSHFRSLSAIRFPRREWATIPAGPIDSRSRLTQGACVPTSSTLRLRCNPPNRRLRSTEFVRTRSWCRISPSAPRTPYQLPLSPRSIPIVRPLSVSHPCARLRCLLAGLLPGT